MAIDAPNQQVVIQEFSLNELIGYGLSLEDIELLKNSGINSCNHLVLNEQLLTGVDPEKVALIRKVVGQFVRELKTIAVLFASKFVVSLLRQYSRGKEVDRKKIGYAYCLAEGYNRQEFVEYMFEYFNVSATTSEFAFNEFLSKDVNRARDYLLNAELMARDRKFLKSLSNCVVLPRDDIMLHVEQLKDTCDLVKNIVSAPSVWEELSNNLDHLRSRIPNITEFNALKNAIVMKGDLGNLKHVVKSEAEKLLSCIRSYHKRSESSQYNDMSACLDSIHHCVRRTTEVVKAFYLFHRCPDFIDEPAELEAMMNNWEAF